MYNVILKNRTGFEKHPFERFNDACAFAILNEDTFHMLTDVNDDIIFIDLFHHKTDNYHLYDFQSKMIIEDIK